MSVNPFPGLFPGVLTAVGGLADLGEVAALKVPDTKHTTGPFPLGWPNVGNGWRELVKTEK